MVSESLDLEVSNTRFQTTWLSPTYKCNNGCWWCYAGGSSPDKEMPIERVNEILKLLNKLGAKRLILVGGEPTVYSELEDLLSTATGLGISTGMVTNGRKLSDYKFTKSLKDKGISGIGITILGSEDIHDRLTKVNGSYRETIEGIMKCKELGIDVTTNTVITEHNKDDLTYILELSDSLGIRRCFFNVCSDDISNPHDYSLSPLRAVEIVSDFLLKNESHHSKIRIVTPMAICNFEDHADDFLKKGLIGGSCGAFYGNIFAIDYNGDVLPCPHFTGFPIFNLFESMKLMGAAEFREIFLGRGNAGESFRSKLWHYPSTSCVDSDKYGESCLGGCPIQWFKYNPEENIKGGKKNGKFS